jgi:hypothetical protein
MNELNVNRTHGGDGKVVVEVWTDLARAGDNSFGVCLCDPMAANAEAVRRAERRAVYLVRLSVAGGGHADGRGLPRRLGAGRVIGCCRGGGMIAQHTPRVDRSDARAGSSFSSPWGWCSGVRRLRDPDPTGGANASFVDQHGGAGRRNQIALRYWAV